MKTVVGLAFSMFVLAFSSSPILVPRQAVAGDREKIVVMDLRAERGLDEGLAKLLNELILTEFQKSGKYDVFGERDIVSMMNFEDTKIKMTGCSDDSCLAEIGGALGVDIIVASNIGKIGDNYLLNMKMLDVKRAKVRKRVSEIVKAEENALIKAIRKAVSGLTGHTSTPGVQATKTSAHAGESKASAASSGSEAKSGTQAEEPKKAAPLAGKVPQPGQEQSNGSGGKVNLTGWILLGAGLAAAATGGVLGGLAMADKDLSGRSFDSQSEYDDAVDSVNHKALAADIMFGVSGAALLGSAVLFLFFGDEPGKTAVSASALPLRGGCMITAAAGF